MGATQTKWNSGAAALWVPHSPDFAQWGQAVSDDLDGIVPIKVLAEECKLLGGAVASSQGPWGGVSFPDGVVSGISYRRSYPLTWLTALCTWGYSPLSALSGTLNIRWRFRVYKVNVAGVGGDLITDAPQVDVTFSKAAGAQFTMGHVFNVAAAGENSTTGFDLHNADQFLGEVCNITIERVGNDALDTYDTGNVLLTNLSVDPFTRSA